MSKRLYFFALVSGVLLFAGHGMTIKVASTSNWRPQHSDRRSGRASCERTG